jgi:hypothetical protein
MNAMKKWVVAGLIGLSSVGVSMAAIILDSFNGANNTYDPVLVSGWDWDYAVNGGGVGANMGVYNPDPVTWVPGDYRGVYNTVAFNFANDTMTFSGTSGGALYYDYSAGGVGFIPSGLTGISFDWDVATFDGDLEVRLWGTGNLQYVYATLTQGQQTINFGDVIWRDDPMIPENVFALTPGMLANVFAFDFRWSGGTEGSTVWNEIVLNEQGVPEPETVWMMLAVLGSLAVTFRGQLSDLARRFVKS